ncbi:hypothetical protein EON80_14780 [bacterium]|nr:MAG: hypothetical protein EON80_14780 [bacterium]
MIKTRSKFAPALALAALVAALWLSPSPAQAAPAFVTDAFDKAKTAPANNKKWLVTATVIIRPRSPEGKTYRAVGPVTYTDNQLKGSLPLQIDDAPPAADNALFFNIDTPGSLKVGLTWTIAGKPFLGRGQTNYDAKEVPDKNFIRAIGPWQGKLSIIEIYFESREVSTTPPPPINIPGGQKKPIGKRYLIQGYFVVTNSEDGIADNTCEVYGDLYAYGLGKKGSPKRPLINYVQGQDLMKGQTIPFTNKFYVDNFFENPMGDQIVIQGAYWDGDLDSADDDMYRATKRFGLEKSSKLGEINIPGDNDSESLDVRFTVKFVEDLY